jgi:cell division protein ZapA
VAQVSVRINGYSYTVGCEDGQEAHLFAMAEQVEHRIDSIKALGTSTSEQRLLVLTALLLADELHDTRQEAEQLRSQLAKVSRARAEAKSPEKVEAEQQRKAAKLAEQAEQIANLLEHP